MTGHTDADGMLRSPDDVLSGRGYRSLLTEAIKTTIARPFSVEQADDRAEMDELMAEAEIERQREMDGPQDDRWLEADSGPDVGADLKGAGRGYLL